MNDKPKIRLTEDAAPLPTAATTAPSQNDLASSPPATARSNGVPAALATVSSKSQLRTEMTASFASVLFMDPSDVIETKPVGELGMDSVLAVEWVRELNSSYGLALEAIETYDHPTLRAMIKLVAQRLNLVGEGSEEAEDDTLPEEACTATGTPDGTSAPAPQSAAPLSIEEILQQVRDGRLPIEEAERLLGR